MVFNTTFNNISAISRRSDLLMEDSEKTTDLSPFTDKLYHIVFYRAAWNSDVICRGSLFMFNDLK
jgi:hypothetical protein